MVWVKICGITSPEDAIGCVEAGADAIGVNFYQRSPRFCEPKSACRIVEAVGGKILVVAVFVDADYARIRALQEAVRFGSAQLHGAEPPELLERLLPAAYKALRVRGPEAIEQARRYGGEWMLLDAYVPDLPGGTGTRTDWIVAKKIAAERSAILSGGLGPDNVAEAIAAVSPFGVDAASGVESAPGRKDLFKVRDFIQRARGIRSTASRSDPSPAGGRGQGEGGIRR